jgi:hypothetical protein
LKRNTQKSTTETLNKSSLKARATLEITPFRYQVKLLKDPDKRIVACMDRRPEKQQ